MTVPSKMQVLKKNREDFVYRRRSNLENGKEQKNRKKNDCGLNYGLNCSLDGYFINYRKPVN